jgi:hypothetical protein
MLARRILEDHLEGAEYKIAKWPPIERDQGSQKGVVGADAT